VTRGPLKNVVVYGLGVTLNLAGAGCAGWALLLAHREHGRGPIEPAIARLVNRTRSLIARMAGNSASMAEAQCRTFAMTFPFASNPL